MVDQDGLAGYEQMMRDDHAANGVISHYTPGIADDMHIPGLAIDSANMNVSCSSRKTAETGPVRPISNDSGNLALLICKV